MKIYPRDPDLSTIYNRIKEGAIDLQPDFQRDLVWNTAKKQSLVDTILREWHFPPIFLVVPKTGHTLDVLDGQQRLNAIFEFLEGKFAVNGKIEPLDQNISRLDGCYYDQLPDDVKSRFGRYSIRVCELTDYQEEEPYELFFRLNQGTVLTPAEKRNTLYGPVREQVRSIVEDMKNLGFSTDRIGFNNSRLSYEDVVSRLLFALENKSISKKITDQMLIDLFRSGTGVSVAAYRQARTAIDNLSEIIDKKVRLNKPTLFTWLLFLSFERPPRDFFYSFNEMRSTLRSGSDNGEYKNFLLALFQEKAATSVNDAIPVQLRLLVIYLMGLTDGIHFTSHRANVARSIQNGFLENGELSEEKLIHVMNECGWGVA